MATHTIAVIGGDGIGPEVIEHARNAVDATVPKFDPSEKIEWNLLPWSSAYYREHGKILPDDGWDILKKHDAILFGAIGDASVPDRVTIHDSCCRCAASSINT